MKTQSCFWLRAGSSVTYFVCTVAFGVMSPLCFANGMSNIQDTFNKLRTSSVSVTVIIYPKFDTSPVSLTLERLRRFGCTYQYETPVDAGSLLELFDRSEWSEGGETILNDLHFGITFHDKNGHTSTVLLEQFPGRNRTVSMLLDGEPIGASERLPDAIREWVAKTRHNAKAVTGFCNN